MEFTPDQIISLVGIIVGGLLSGTLTIGGWFVVSRLNKANTEKARGEAATIYQKMAGEAAQREEKYQSEISDLRNTVENLENTVADLKETNKKKDLLIADQEKRIGELERSNSNLELEIQALHNKRK